MMKYYMKVVLTNNNLYDFKYNNLPSMLDGDNPTTISSNKKEKREIFLRYIFDKITMGTSDFTPDGNDPYLQSLPNQNYLLVTDIAQTQLKMYLNDILKNYNNLEEYNYIGLFVYDDNHNLVKDNYGFISDYLYDNLNSVNFTLFKDFGMTYWHAIETNNNVINIYRLHSLCFNNLNNYWNCEDFCQNLNDVNYITANSNNLHSNVLLTVIEDYGFEIPDLPLHKLYTVTPIYYEGLKENNNFKDNHNFIYPFNIDQEIERFAYPLGYNYIYSPANDNNYSTAQDTGYTNYTDNISSATNLGAGLKLTIVPILAHAGTQTDYIIFNGDGKTIPNQPLSNFNIIKKHYLHAYSFDNFAKYFNQNGAWQGDILHVFSGNHYNISVLYGNNSTNSFYLNYLNINFDYLSNAVNVNKLLSFYTIGAPLINSACFSFRLTLQSEIIDFIDSATNIITYVNNSMPTVLNDQGKIYLNSYQSQRQMQIAKSVVEGVSGAAAGVLGGAAAGALIGSVIPGIGTLIGGLVGGLIGGAAGATGGIMSNQDRVAKEKDIRNLVSSPKDNTTVDLLSLAGGLNLLSFYSLYMNEYNLNDGYYSSIVEHNTLYGYKVVKNGEFENYMIVSRSYYDYVQFDFFNNVIVNKMSNQITDFFTNLFSQGTRLGHCHNIKTVEDIDKYGTQYNVVNEPIFKQHIGIIKA